MKALAVAVVATVWGLTLLLADGMSNSVFWLMVIALLAAVNVPGRRA